MARSSSMSISKESVAEESARMDCLGMKRVRRRMEVMLFRGRRKCQYPGNSGSNLYHILNKTINSTQ